MRRHVRKRKARESYAHAYVRYLSDEAPLVEMLEDRRLLSLTPSGGNFFVSTNAAIDNSIPQIAHDAAGNFAVTWQAGNTVRARLYDASGNPLAADFQVNTPVSGTQAATPSIAMSPSGEFVIAFATNFPISMGGIEEVYARRFDAAGNAQASEVHVNTETELLQIKPDVAMDATGAFVVVWQSGHSSASP